ncbi:hypothetical protein LOTGIDRAFT_231876 [Lottia gigantea]|uniref:Glycosyl transferase family 25 domain-containing protein n=1 Tax=Lottia gigantea TaxID=225164 RepID=V4C3S0_LOTGI|nr:hypothetical protein LOTGIDRAFT_231876 [Lottia gigantea]ESO96194.1 hypothetical protein LOTGIDRAFT_231876 [Lottia gigantea]
MASGSNKLSLKTRGILYLCCVVVSLMVIEQIFQGCHSLEDKEVHPPTVLIAFLVRNKAHTLPWFLGHIEKLDYPKNRITLWIRSDHNKDNSSEILEEWLAGVQHQYHNVDVIINSKRKGYSDERSTNDWTKKRFKHVIKLRQQALEMARQKWADYFMMLDSDVIIENNRTLHLLMQQEKTIIAPMMNASIIGYYSNFWGGMDKKGYYVRTKEYIQMVDLKIRGCYKVPMVHSIFLVDLRRSATDFLAYSPSPPKYKGPYDDIIIFAHSVKAAGISMFVLNTQYFGKVMVPLDWQYSLSDERDQFTYVKLEAMVDGPQLYRSPHVYVPPTPQSKLGFDEIYMINLLRRPERRERMVHSLYDLGIDAKLFDAIDGKNLNDTFLDELGIDMLPGFADPYQGRALTMGEIGCFLSHYTIWEEVIAKKYEKILIFEDDVRFEPYFKRKLYHLMDEVDKLVPNWDLVYLGRKRLDRDSEKMVENSETLIWPSYSYWTLSYMLSHRGAVKLMSHKPLHRMIPVDEYLPILFNKHPTKDWMIQFEPRNLVGLSAEPLLLYPTHYTGETNYFSDTEESTAVPKDDWTGQQITTIW